MDRNTALLIAGRVAVFFVAVFFVLTMIFVMFFVVADGIALVPRNPSANDEAIFDDLKIDEAKGEQYVNFMVKMLSGEFFLSSGIRPLAPVSDFIYDAVFATVARLTVVTAAAVVGGFGYALLADRCPKDLGGFMRGLALIMAVIPAAILFLLFRMALLPLGYSSVDTLPIELLIFSIIPLTAASAFVFERIVRRISPDRSGSYVNRTLRAIAAPRVSAIMPLFLAFAMTSVLTAEYFAHHRDSSGIGWIMMSSVHNYDIQAFMACAFIISSMLLMMFLVFDITILLASAPHSVQRRTTE